jgi:hypothetical protein
MRKRWALAGPAVLVAAITRPPLRPEAIDDACTLGREPLSTQSPHAGINHE